MKKSLILLPFLLSGVVFASNFNNGEINASATEDLHECIYNLSQKEDGTYNIDSLKEGYFDRSDYRIYSNYDGMVISSIDNDVFANCNLMTSLMLSSRVLVSDISLFYSIDNLLEVRYTGSEQEFKEKYSSFDMNNYSISYYQNDEGFINYWDEVVRVDATQSICDIGEAGYRTLLSKYNALTTPEKIYVNAYEDVAGNLIKDSMQYLKDHFDVPQKANNSNQLSQQDSIITILIIATFGMSTITVFYLLKKKNIID